ncbi:MAG: YkgJ family cysteine cluster protein [Candidatus Zambryskibacteria bacterium]
MGEKFGPCLEKNCSVCCNPVKIARFLPEEEIPKGTDGNNLWQKRKELLMPDNKPGEIKLETYDCKNFNHENGLCRDYENRPDICRGSGCVDPNIKESEEEQFKKLSEQKFIKIT